MQHHMPTAIFTSTQHREAGLDPRNLKIMSLDLASLASVRQFAKDLKAFASGRTIDSLVSHCFIISDALALSHCFCSILIVSC